MDLLYGQKNCVHSFDANNKLPTAPSLKTLVIIPLSFAGTIFVNKTYGLHDAIETSLVCFEFLYRLINSNDINKDAHPKYIHCV